MFIGLVDEYRTLFRYSTWVPGKSVNLNWVAYPVTTQIELRNKEPGSTTFPASGSAFV